MRRRFFDIAFTPDVQAEQSQRGSRAAYEKAKMQAAVADNDGLSPTEADFIAGRDSFYIATVSTTGWPYVQHRGGPRGFVRRLDDTTIGWSEFAGNRQYVSVGNIAANDKVAMIFVDYPNRRRLKVLGHMRSFDAASRPDLAPHLAVDGYKARVEGYVTVDVAAFDWNCPQHITPRFDLAEVRSLVTPLHERIAELETRLAGYEAR